MVIPNTLTSNLYVTLVIQPVVLQLMNSIQGRVFQQDNDRPHTAFETQYALQNADMIPALIIPVLAEQWSSIPQNDATHAHLEAFIQNSGGYTGY